MALETVVYPQDPFSHCVNKEYYYPSLVGGSANNWDRGEFGLELDEQEEQGLYGVIDNNNCNNNLDQGVHRHHHPYHQANNWDSSTTSPPPLMQNVNSNNSTWDPNSSSPDNTCTNHHMAATTTGGGRRKRRRSKSTKNKEEIENQRMTHIAVERNRRKQMNEYLAVLRSLMPPSYSQRGDQASIIGGAINFVKELEQLLQSMEAQRGTTSSKLDKNGPMMASSPSTPFAEFFSFPQYSTRTTPSNETMGAADNHRWAVADIEVTMVESHANMKILSKKRPRQLLKLVAGLQSLRLSILHLNVTTVDDMILYSLSVKVEEGCHMGTVDEIAAGMNQLLHTIEEEATGCAF